MKTNFKLLISFLVLGLLTANSMFAQSTTNIPAANSTPDGVITFDANVPLSGIYEFDFSEYNYSEAKAQGIANNLETVTHSLNTTLDYSNQKIVIMIDQTDPVVEGWDVNAWNDYLIEAQK